MKTALIVVFVGMAIGNYSFQYFTNQNWVLANDRTWFQAVTLIAAYFAIGINKA